MKITKIIKFTIIIVFAINISLSYSIPVHGNNLDSYYVSSNQNSNQSSYDKKLEKEIDRAANQIFRGSLELFKEGAYWDCARELIILMDYHSTFEKMDEIVYYLGQCLFEEELGVAATRMFKYLLKKFPRSPMVPAALLGLEKTYYHQNEYKQALRVYFALLKKAPEEKEILNAASYFAGQSHFNLKNYDMAINLLKKIDSRSSYYDVALYCTALSYLKKSNVSVSVDYLRKIISLPNISGERRNIIDNARLTLGFMYYELNAYKPATKLFLGISDKHENYQDALLGLGWCFIKLEDNESVIKYLDKLIKLYPDSENAEEAYFLLGQAYIALGKYEKAIDAYQTIVENFPDDFQIPSLIKKVNSGLEIEEDRVEKLKVKVLIEETKLLDAIAMNGYGENIPRYLIEEKKELKDFREKLIKNLLNERDSLLLMQENIDSLKKLAERRERRKNWRGYAEYGTSRALFLKQMEKRARGK